MKLFSWMQNKLNGKQGSNTKPNAVISATPEMHALDKRDDIHSRQRQQGLDPEGNICNHVKQECREEFSDWPHGLLAIGTFGNKEVGENNEIQDVPEDQLVEEEDPSSSHDLQDFTPEEIGKLQKELTKLLTRKPTSQDKEKEIANLPLDRFLNCPSSLEVDRRVSSNRVIGGVDDKEDDIERTISVILGRCKDICENNKKKSIGKKSISFLLKKIFVCRSGFAPQPSMRDTLQESRMEKLLRTLLLKKINPQATPRASSMKRYIEDKRNSKMEKQDDEKGNKTGDGSKWVKTDSEYIVLEI